MIILLKALLFVVCVVLALFVCVVVETYDEPPLSILVDFVKRRGRKC